MINAYTKLSATYAGREISGNMQVGAEDTACKTAASHL